MPKTIELTIQFEIQRVSCPGVWLCQDGRVSLSVFALGTNYQTCLLPPMFPLLFKDKFYYRKKFQEKCALSNMCCLLKGETIYCELVQWCEDCNTGSCTILAQYLGALNDVLFPSDMCSNDGVDLLMRRSKEFPGILSPKIEIATKVRIDEVWNNKASMNREFPMKPTATCECYEDDKDAARQKQVCHSPEYHRTKCSKAYFGCAETRRPTSAPRSRSRSRSHSAARSSHCSLLKKPDRHESCKYPTPPSFEPRRSPRHLSPPMHGERGTGLCPQTHYNVYNVRSENANWTGSNVDGEVESDTEARFTDTEKMNSPTEDRLQKTLLESRYIEEENNHRRRSQEFRKPCVTRYTPCVCEICKKYHEQFHTNLYSVKDQKG